MRGVAWLGLLVAASVAARGDDGKPPETPKPEAPKAVVLCDFETGEPSDGWEARRLGLAEIETPHGRGLKLTAKDPSADTSYVRYAHRACPVADWRTASAFAMSVRVESKSPVEMRVMANARGGGRKQRRFTLEPGDWREVVLPLKEFRDDSDDRCGSFADVARIVLRWDKGAGDVSIDDLRLLPGDRGALSCTKTVEDWRRLAFGDAKARVVESAHFVLLDDVPALSDDDCKRVLARMEEGLVVLAERYGVSGELGDKVPFFLFATRDEYAAFPPRLGEHFGAVVGAPTADGFGIFGAAMSSFDPAQGWNRRVFVHEAMHGAVQRLLGVSNNGNWIQEALATAVQCRFHPETFDRTKLAESFAAGKGWIVPWSELFAKPGAPLNRYPQYASIMEFLAEKHADALPAAWDAVRALNAPVHSAAMPAIAKALGVDVAKLEAEWLAWGAAFYGPTKDK